MNLRTDVSALYVDPLGPYPTLVADWWSESRDARRYTGPNPVVAHPDCGPYGRLHRQNIYGDRTCALRAVEQVRAFGGVLEHPSGSTLWRELGLPLPQELPDAFGGRTIAVDQVSWGHACRKPSWLYLVGVPSIHGLQRGGEPTHQIWGSRTPGRKHRCDLKAAHAAMRRRTPRAFATWLIDLAASAKDHGETMAKRVAC